MTEHIGHPDDSEATGDGSVIAILKRLRTLLGSVWLDITPKYAVANVAQSQTDASVVAAVALKQIRVLAMASQAGGTATTLTFNSKGSGAGVAISCLFANAANDGAVLPFNPAGWFETVAGEALTVTTGAGSTTGIQVTYLEV